MASPFRSAVAAYAITILTGIVIVACAGMIAIADRTRTAIDMIADAFARSMKGLFVRMPRPRTWEPAARSMTADHRASTAA